MQVNLKRKKELIPEVAERIRKIRERLNLTQAEFGGRLKDPTSENPLTQSAVKNYESRNIPEAHVLLQLAALGETSVDWILTGSATASFNRRQIQELTRFFHELPQLTDETLQRLERSVRLLRRLRDEIGITPGEVIDAAAHSLQATPARQAKERSTKTRHVGALSKGRTRVSKK